MRKIWIGILLSALFSTLCLLSSCTDEAAERIRLRKTLDEQFEKETAILVKKAAELDITLNKLMLKHEELDRELDKLDQKLKGFELSTEDKKMQKHHLALEIKHARLFKEAEDLLKRFERINVFHEEKEENHAIATPDDIVREHEEFEDTLKSFAREFAMEVAKFKKAEEEQAEIQADHKKMEAKHLKAKRNDIIAR